MKEISIPLYLTVFLGIFVGCTKSENVVYEDEIASKVYFVQAVSGQMTEVSEATLDENGTVSFCIYNAGNNPDEITVSIIADQDALDIYNVENGTSYQMLPEKYWSLSADSFVMDTKEHYQAYLQLTVDFDAIRADGINVDSYLLSLSVSVPDMANVTYDYKTLFVKVVL